MSIAPILFLMWNRPEKTLVSLQSIKRLRPPKIYIACDGPILDDSESKQLVMRCRKIVDEEVDWNCTLVKRYLETNQGCKLGVAGAIDWFFNQENEGIIIEDDIVCDESFFLFASELLTRFRYDDRVGCITANYFGPKDGSCNKESYSATSFPHIWGWATWKRAWKYYDCEISDYRLSVDFIDFYKQFGLRFAIFWTRTLYLVRNGNINTWDYQLMYMFLKRRLVCIQPMTELASNIGFDTSGTHTNDANVDSLSMGKRGLIEFPLLHPKESLRINKRLDKLKFFRNYWPRKLRLLGLC